MTRVKLIGTRRSGFVNRVQIALNLKSVKYDFLVEKLGSKSELLLKSNPIHKKVPVLIHDEKSICESLLIVQYIDEVWTSGPSILPSDPYERAIALFWAAYIDDKCYPSVRDLIWGGSGAEKLAAKNQLDGTLVLLEEYLVKCIEGGKLFFGGNQIGYVDIALGCLLGWLKAAEKLADQKVLDEKKTPELVRWVEMFLKEDTVKGVIPETEELLEFAKNFQPKAHPSN